MKVLQFLILRVKCNVDDTYEGVADQMLKNQNKYKVLNDSIIQDQLLQKENFQKMILTDLMKRKGKKLLSVKLFRKI
jgi:hypothetical protein